MLLLVVVPNKKQVLSTFFVSMTISVSGMTPLGESRNASYVISSVSNMSRKSGSEVPADWSAFVRIRVKFT